MRGKAGKLQDGGLEHKEKGEHFPTELISWANLSEMAGLNLKATELKPE